MAYGGVGGYGVPAYGYGQPVVYGQQYVQPAQQPVQQVVYVREDQCCGNRLRFLIVGIVLTAIAGVATYFCLVHGLQLLDTATTSLGTFGAGFLIYSGVVFSLVAVGNALYTGGKLLCHDEGTPYNYSGNEMKYQIGVSILAPIAAIPAVIICALGAACKR